MIKPGRTAAAAKAGASHTGALTGQDEVLDAAFRRCGVVRVNTIAELFYLSHALDKQPRPKGPRLTIVTNAGGPAVLATDALLAEGGQLAELAPSTIEQLSGCLPRHWSHQNPIDIIGDAGAERYAKAVDLAVKDPATDGLLVILAPTGLTDPSAVAQELTSHAKVHGKPVIASWMGGQDIAAGEAILNQAGIPTYHYPDAASRVFQLMWNYSANIKALYETPETFEPQDADRAEISELIDSIRARGRTILTEAESKAILRAYGIPTVATEIVANQDQAVSAAGHIGYPWFSNYTPRRSRIRPTWGASGSIFPMTRQYGWPSIPSRSRFRERQALNTFKV